MGEIAVLILAYDKGIGEEDIRLKSKQIVYNIYFHGLKRRKI